jgi:prepilin-type N-terminal cleavage/methylation domain-containing protein
MKGVPMPKASSGNGGFTLIELLVAMAVLLILIIAFGAYWLAGRPHARLASAANDLVSDIRAIRTDAGKRGVTSGVGTDAVCKTTTGPPIACIDFTSTTRYRVVDATGTTVAIRQFNPTLAVAGEIGRSGEYQGAVFSAAPTDIFACSSGMFNVLVAAPASSSACDSQATSAIILNHPDVDSLSAGAQPEFRTICVTSAGSATCWRTPDGTATGANCDNPPATWIRC